LRKLYLLSLLIIAFQSVISQPMADTMGKLIVQKENVIKATTILQIENLGININSELPEMRPTISADGTLLFFICQNHPANTKFRDSRNSQDIWYSEKDSTGKWGEAIHMDYPLNLTYYNAVYWVSPDKNKILIRGAFQNGAFMGRGEPEHQKK